MLGPFTPGDMGTLPALHINRFGVIPKGHNTGKWRLITDLSHPPGSSVNDGVDPEISSLTYISVDHVAETVASYQPGALLAKVDIESAYRLVPVHPLDRPLQAMEWKGRLYVDPMLPFGLRSAPKIFNALANGLEWHLRDQGISNVFHYLDDFIVVAPPEAIIRQACTRLGVPLAEHNSAAGEVAEQRISPLHQDTPGSIGSHLSYTRLSGPPERPLPPPPLPQHPPARNTSSIYM